MEHQEQIDSRIRTSLERKFLHRHNSPPTKEARQCFFFQTAITLILLFLVLLFSYYLTGTQLVIGALFILVSIINTGALLEKQHWIFYLEISRILLLVIFINNCYSTFFLWQESVSVWLRKNGFTYLSDEYKKLTQYYLLLNLNVKNMSTILRDSNK